MRVRRRCPMRRRRSSATEMPASQSCLARSIQRRSRTRSAYATPRCTCSSLSHAPPRLYAQRPSARIAEP
jgi:hypothetical protein